MNIPVDLQTLEDDVLRKIGRNLMLLQEVEGMLKTLLTQSSAQAGPDPAIEMQQAKRNEMLAKQTLGALAGQFTKEVFAPKDETTSESEPEFPAGYVTFKYSIQADEAYLQQRTASLKLVVDERNELVHHFLPKWTRGLLESARAADQHLDQQHGRILVEFETLKAHLEAMQRSRVLLHSFMSSPEYERQMEKQWLQSSRIVHLLAEMSRRAVNADGWVQLDAAGQALWVNAREDMSSLRAMYGYPKLKPLLVASEVFEMRDQPLSDGCSRVQFRLKNDAQAIHDGR